MNGTDQVDAYMGALEHPLKVEMAAVRAIIMIWRMCTPRKGRSSGWSTCG